MLGERLSETREAGDRCTLQALIRPYKYDEHIPIIITRCF